MHINNKTKKKKKQNKTHSIIAIATRGYRRPNEGRLHKSLKKYGFCPFNDNQFWTTVPACDVWAAVCSSG